MLSMILELKENDNRGVVKVAEYTTPPKKALVSYVMQNVFHNFNTWEYPEILKGMRESDTVKDHWYYDDFAGRRVLASYPQ